MTHCFIFLNKEQPKSERSLLFISILFQRSQTVRWREGKQKINILFFTKRPRERQFPKVFSCFLCNEIRIHTKIRIGKMAFSKTFSKLVLNACMRFAEMLKCTLLVAFIQKGFFGCCFFTKKNVNWCNYKRTKIVKVFTIYSVCKFISK